MIVKKRDVFFIFIVIVCVTCQAYGFSFFGSDNTERSSNSSDSEMKPSGKFTLGAISLLARAISAFLRRYYDYNIVVPQEQCNCTCGEANIHKTFDSRIVGGDEVIPFQYPWMAHLSYLGRFYCGGSLINSRYVLTAEHCTHQIFQSMIKVTLGNHNRCDRNWGQWSSHVSWVDSQPSRLAPFFGKDIALLRLDYPAPINQFIQPICLPKSEDLDYGGSMATVAGWGRVGEETGPACSLRAVKLPIMSNNNCFQHTNYKNVSHLLQTSNLMCAGWPWGGVSACLGDSGGPLMVKRESGQYEIAGIVSFGLGCARPKFPGVYTRVTRHIDWIRQNTPEGCYCRH